MCCVQHQPSVVPSKPLGGLSTELMKQEAPLAAAVEPLKYNQMAPPMTAYTAEYALAKASGSHGWQPPAGVYPLCRPIIAF